MRMLRYTFFVFLEAFALIMVLGPTVGGLIDLLFRATGSPLVFITNWPLYAGTSIVSFFLGLYIGGEASDGQRIYGSEEE